MSALEALKAARAAGIEIHLDGNDLVLEAATTPPSSVLHELSLHKSGVVEILRGGHNVQPRTTPTVDTIIDDQTIAVLIDSEILGAPIWFAFKDGWQPGKGDEQAPVFYASELPVLRQNSPDQLRSIFNVKRAFGGGMVRH